MFVMVHPQCNSPQASSTSIPKSIFDDTSHQKDEELYLDKPAPIGQAGAAPI